MAGVLSISANAYKVGPGATGDAVPANALREPHAAAGRAVGASDRSLSA